MIRRLTILSAIAVTAASAQLTTTFKDGTHLRIRTESTASRSTASTNGLVSVNEGNNVQRLVFERGGRILFGYTIEAWGIPNARELYFVRIKPLDAAFEASLRSDLDFKKKPPVSEGGKIATLAAVRNFPSIRLGEAVSVDILSNPATGERIYDVIEPSTAPSETVKQPEDSFSLMSVRVVLNGKTVLEPNGAGTIGAAAMIYVPGHGGFYLALDPVPGYNFIPSGRVNRDVLTFGEGPDWVEVTSKSNVLTKSGYRTVWVYHDPAFRNGEEPYSGTADDIRYLLPKKRP